ncbi:MAG: MCE family protein, partial [Actinomycetota bacterium]|nr:MCE family protein [Actinomycetota bacterium]
MKNTAIKLAAFTLFTIVVTFYLATVIGNITPFAHTYQIHAVYSDATGVLNGDPVKISGVLVGKVTHFEVTHGQAVLDLQIDGDVELPANVQADIKYRNLLGQRVVDLIVPPDPSSELMKDNGTIPNSNTHPALDLSAVFNNLRPLIQSTNPEDINTVTRAIVKVFSGKEDELAGILGNVGALTKTLAGHDQRLARFVTDFNKVSRILNHEGGSISTGIEKFGRVMESLARVTPTIRSLVDRLNAASGKFG